MNPNPARSQRRAAFTLIEILSVIAILGLLIGILLPSLSRARATSKELVCRANLKQMGSGALLYAQDFDERVWPVKLDASGGSFPSTGAAWARLPGPGGTVVPGLMYKYVDTVDEIGECPSNRRGTEISDSGENMFGGDTPLDFDYTFIANLHGLKLSKAVRVAFRNKPENIDINALPPELVVERSLTKFPGIPIFVEENTRFYNQDVADGLWSNKDQFETRHNGRGNIAYIEGHVESFKPVMGNLDNLEEKGDLNANDIYVNDNLKYDWVRLEKGVSNLRPYGWINMPRP